MKLTARQEYILDDGLGCGSSRESSLTSALIEEIEHNSAIGGYKSQAFDDYIKYHQNKDCSHCIDDGGDEDMKRGSKKRVFYGVLEMLVDLIDYSEFEIDENESYGEIDNGNVYGDSQLNEHDYNVILDGYDRAGYIDAEEQKVADKIKIHLYGLDSVEDEE